MLLKETIFSVHIKAATPRNHLLSQTQATIQVGMDLIMDIQRVAKAMKMMVMGK